MAGGLVAGKLAGDGVLATLPRPGSPEDAGGLAELSLGGTEIGIAGAGVAMIAKSYGSHAMIGGGIAAAAFGVGALGSFLI